MRRPYNVDRWREAIAALRNGAKLKALKFPARETDGIGFTNEIARQTFHFSDGAGQ